MKLLLKSEVKNLGRAGDIVEVKDGYGRNFLVPQGLAMQVTAANIKTIEAEKARLKAVEAELVVKLKEVAERINNVDITISALVSDGESLYGAVQPREICDALMAEGIEIDSDYISPDKPLKKLGVHRVPVKLHPEVIAELKVWVVEKKDPNAKVEEDEVAEEATEAAE